MQSSKKCFLKRTKRHYFDCRVRKPPQQNTKTTEKLVNSNLAKQKLAFLTTYYQEQKTTNFFNVYDKGVVFRKYKEHLQKSVSHKTQQKVQKKIQLFMKKDTKIAAKLMKRYLTVDIIEA